MLHDDPQALRACSLTCKAMFASARSLIHRTLHLTRRNNESGFIREEAEKFCSWEWIGSDDNDLKLSLVSYLGECGLLRYTRQVHIHNSCMFTPDTLQPHLHHFQSLDRVHALTIDHYHAVIWQKHYISCFIHFYPTLTSLTLHRPFGHDRLTLHFVLQFPNLKNLCLEWPQSSLIPPAVTVPAVVDQLPPLCGHLRLAGLDGVVRRLIDLACQPRNGINFRSLELEDPFDRRSHAQRILNACADTLENLTITPHGNGTRRVSFLSLSDFSLIGYMRLRYLTFKELTRLRRLTLRTFYTPASGLAFGFLSVSTITSPLFHEFVLELNALSSRFDGPSPAYWGRWEEIDRLFEERFGQHGGFRLVIRTAELRDQDAFQRHAEGSFPLLAARGCIHFEKTHD